jgi:hypothetical protein
LTRAPRVALAVCSVAVATGLLVGCGASAEEQVGDTVKRFYRAASEGDGDEACGLLTQAARTVGGPGQCEAAIEQLGKLGGPETRKRLGDVTVRKTKVDGERASTQTELAGQGAVTLQLRRVDGEWKLDSFGAPSGGQP